MTSRRAAQVVVMGVSGSGKSTVAAILADRMGCEMAEADRFHSSGNIAKMESGTPLDDDDRRPWLDAIAAWIALRAQRDTPAVVTCSALKRSYRDVLRSAGAGVCFLHLAGPQELVADRIGGRSGHFMPPGLLASQYADLEALAADEPGATVDLAATPEQIVDEAVRRLGLAMSGPAR
jgi:gluconokinase